MAAKNSAVTKRPQREPLHYSTLRVTLTYALGFIVAVALTLMLLGAATGGVLPVSFLLLTAVYYGIPIGVAVALFVFVLRRRSPDRSPASTALLTALFGSIVAVLMVSVQTLIANGTKGFGDVLYTVYQSVWFAMPLIFALAVTATVAAVAETKHIRYREAVSRQRR